MHSPGLLLWLLLLLLLRLLLLRVGLDGGEARQ
jgi:hypothetical protein